VIGTLRPSRRALLFVTAVVVALELWVAAGQALTFARIGHQNLNGPSYLVRDADLDPLSYFASTQALVLARETIPSDATYAVVVGNNPPVADAGGIKLVFRFWLFPRKYTRRLAAADWVIAYHHSSETLGVPYENEIGLGPDASAVQVKR
jgi:hypothetical protein